MVIFGQSKLSCYTISQLTPAVTLFGEIDEGADHADDISYCLFSTSRTYYHQQVEPEPHRNRPHLQMEPYPFSYW